MGSFNGIVLILLFFVLSTEGMILDGCGSTSLVRTTIPLNLWDVSSPLMVSSSRSMLFQAKVVNTPGWMFAGRGKSPSDREIFLQTEGCVNLFELGVGYTVTKSAECMYQLNIPCQ